MARAGWSIQPTDGLPLWRSSVLSSYANLAHAFTGIGGNLSRRSGVDASNSADRRRNVCELLGLDATKLVCGAQVHGNKVTRVDDAFLERHDPDRAVPETDGLVTQLSGVPLLALSADCPLIVLYDEALPALGIAHSGWRGTIANMPGALVNAMVDHCNANTNRCIAVVSPCAGGNAYEIRDDVRDQVEQSTGDAERFVNRSEGKMHLDLPRLIANQLENAGISKSAIHLPVHCSISDQRFYSYRRDGANAGHAGLIVGINQTEPRP